GPQPVGVGHAIGVACPLPGVRGARAAKRRGNHDAWRAQLRVVERDRGLDACLPAVAPGQRPGQPAPLVVGRLVGRQAPAPQAAPARGVPPLNWSFPLHATRIEDPAPRRKSPAPRNLPRKWWPWPPIPRQDSVWRIRSTFLRPPRSRAPSGAWGGRA